MSEQNEGANQKGCLDFFLSYIQSDERWATWIARQLEDAGYTTFSEAWDVRPGTIVLVEKEDALTRADGILLVVTSAYLASLAVTLERAAAFSGDKLLNGYRLCGICERIYSTAFSLFLLPATQDRNVYLELGIAIGLGKPLFKAKKQSFHINLVS